MIASPRFEVVNSGFAGNRDGSGAYHIDLREVRSDSSMAPSRGQMYMRITYYALNDQCQPAIGTIWALDNGEKPPQVKP